MSNVDPPPRRDRNITVTLTGPARMLEPMAELLRSEGYIATRKLAEAFDHVLAAYLAAHPRASPSLISAAEIGLWCAAVAAAAPAGDDEGGS